MTRVGQPAEVIGWVEGEEKGEWGVCVRYFMTEEEIEERAQLNIEVTASSLRQRAIKHTQTANGKA